MFILSTQLADPTEPISWADNYQTMLSFRQTNNGFSKRLCGDPISFGAIISAETKTKNVLLDCTCL